MIAVFIAMPYGDHNTPEARLANAEAAIRVWHRLTDAGFMAYCPHWTHFANEVSPRPRNHWLAVAKRWLTKCDCVLTLGDETDGVKEECRFAHVLDKPVYLSIEALASAYGMEV